MKPRFYRIAMVAAWGLVLGPVAAWAQTPAPAAAAPAVNAQLQKEDIKFANGVAAVVNDKIITLKQVKQQMDLLVKGISDEAMARHPDDEAAYNEDFHKQLLVLEKQIVHDLVDNILIVDEFHEKYQPLPKAFLDKQFDDYITNDPKFKGDYEAYLSNLRANEKTERDDRKDMEDSIIISYMDQQLKKTMSGISPGRIKKYYDAHQKDFDQEEAVKLRQITLKPVADNTMDLLMQQANLIVQQARLPGANFADLARKYSQDDFAKDGGLFADDNGWLERKKYIPVLEDVIFKLKPGEVSDPVTNNGNVYIFECDDKRAEGIQPLESDSVHTAIEAILANQDWRDAKEERDKKLEAKAYIRYNLGAPDGS